MMGSRIRIEHSTLYRYRRPVSLGLHRLVIRPREGHDLQVEALSLLIEPNYNILWKRDLFGNSIALVTFPNMSQHLLIKVQTDISLRTHPTPIFIPNTSVGLPVSYGDFEQGVVQGYLEPVYPLEVQNLKSWVRGLNIRMNPSDAITLAEKISNWIYHNIKYRRREERGVQTPTETLRLGSGSCRDMATLLLESVRTQGLAARFASGYLDSAASAAGHAATHAWVEIYTPQSGWLGMDPTLNERSSSKHITLGVSPHPRGVMPVSGTYDGPNGMTEGMDVSVKITHLS